MHPCTSCYTVCSGAITSKHIFAGTSRIATRVITAEQAPRERELDGSESLGGLTVETTSVMGTSSPDTGTGSAPPGNSTLGKAANDSTFADSGHPGKGLANRSDRANEVARNTEKNPHLSGSHPGQGLENRSDRANERAQNTVKNPHLIGGGDGGTPPDTGTPGGDSGGGNGGGGSAGAGVDFLYYYHPDHLGSTGYVTDDQGQLYEHVLYFPFGETWVEQASNTWRTPYLYTSKELDPETGLYYFGARYYDPRTSVWQSADPILGKYLPTGDPENDASLPGLGGILNSRNLNLLHYSGLNPVKFVDPDGNAMTVHITSAETGRRSFVRSRTGMERRDDARAGNQVNVDTDVPTYRVTAANDSGETFSFDVTRHAFRDRDGDGGLENKTFKGEGWFGGVIRTDGGLGARIEIRDFETNSAMVAEPDGTMRSNIQTHIGPGASEGCNLICGGISKRNEVMDRINAMLTNDREAGYGDEIFVNYDRLNDARIEVPEYP